MLSLIAGCGKPRQPQLGEQFVVEKSAEREPNWMNVRPSDREGRMFFVGAATRKFRVEDAQTDARMNATRQVVEYMGGTGLVDYTSARRDEGFTDVEASRFIEDGNRFLAQSIAEGMREEEVYRKKVREWTRDGWRYWYDYSVLISIPSDGLTRAADRALQQHMNQAKQQQDVRAQGLLQRLRDNLTTDASMP